MNELNYYRMDYAAEIRRFSERALKGSGAMTAPQKQICSCLASSAAKRELPSIFEALSKEEKGDFPSFRQAVKEAWPEHAYLDGNPSSADDYFESIRNAQEIPTLEFLAISCFRLSCEADADLPDSVQRRAHRLLSKFETFGRIFSNYDANFRKKGGGYAASTLYVLFASLLFGIYEKNRNLAFLNSALKVTDLLIVAQDRIVEPCETVLSLAALCESKRMIGALYEAEGFRLPACQ